MNRPEVYHRSVQILYDAYFNDELKHMDCKACAVGNIVKGSGVPLCTNDLFMYSKGDYFHNAAWGVVFGTNRISFQEYMPQHMNKAILKTIEMTGYSLKDLMRIEFAFENAANGGSDDEWMFNGLVAVLEVLKEIHEVTDEDLIQSNSKRFKNHYERKLSIVR